MLETAAGCLELASQRVFQSSHQCVRTGRVLPQLFWIDSRREKALVRIRQSLARQSKSQNLQARCSSSQDTIGTPLLDFLYPTRTIQTVERQPFSTQHRTKSRRKKQNPVAGPRAFSTTTQEHIQSNGPVQPSLRRSDPTKSRKRALTDLLVLMQRAGCTEYERMWSLFSAAGQPPIAYKSLFFSLASSKRRKDRHRAVWIAEQLRTTKEPWPARFQEQLIKLHMELQNHQTVIELCKESVLAFPKKNHWSAFFLQFLFQGRHEEAISLWLMQPDQTEVFKSDLVSPGLLSSAHFTEHALSFLRRLSSTFSDKPDDVCRGARQVAKLLMRSVCENEAPLRDITSTQLLSLIDLTADYGLLSPASLIEIIGTLTSFKKRSKLIQAASVLRVFCDRFPSQKPNLRSLRQLFVVARDFQAVSTLDFVAEKLYSFHGSAPESIFYERLLAHARLGDCRKVEEVYSAYVKAHYGEELEHMVPQSYLGTKILAYGVAGNALKAAEVYNLISSRFEALTKQTRNWFLNALCRANDLEGALEHFTDILRLGEQDIFTFNIIMKFFGLRGDVAALQELLLIAQAREIELTPGMLQTLVRGLCQNQKLAEAETIILKWSALSGKKESPHVWNALLGAYALRGDLKTVLRIQHKMKERAVEWDQMTLARLMQAFVQVRQTEAARMLLREVIEYDQMEVLPFHYTILFNGYRREQNGEMLSAIYHEMMDRFSRLDLSARTEQLKHLANAQLKEVEESFKRTNTFDFKMEHMKRFLLALLNEIDLFRGVSSRNRRNLREVDPHFYYELVIATQGADPSNNDVQKLMFAYLKGRDSIPEIEDDTTEDWGNNPSPVPFLTTLMSIQAHSDDHDGVIRTFELAVSSALQVAYQTDLSNLRTSPEGTQTFLDTSLPPKFLDSFRSKHEDGPQMIPHRRYMLSRPFNVYIRTIAQRRGMYAVNVAIADFVAQGFALTTFNFTLYVELLALSPDFKDVFRAFTLFEEKFVPNLPAWAPVRRTRRFHPSEKVDPASNAFGRDRALISKKESDIIAKFADPSFMQPTYVCLIHLGTAMIRIRETSLKDGGLELEKLMKLAPKTYQMVLETPYVKDAVQGALLRGHDPFPNPTPQQGRPKSNATVGVFARPSLSASAARVAAREDDEESSQLAFAMWEEALGKDALAGDILLDVEDELKDLDCEALNASLDHDHEVPITSESSLTGSDHFTQAIFSPPITHMWRSFDPKYHSRHLIHKDIVLYRPYEENLELEDAESTNAAGKRISPVDKLASLDIAASKTDETQSPKDKTTATDTEKPLGESLLAPLKPEALEDPGFRRISLVDDFGGENPEQSPDLTPLESKALGDSGYNLRVMARDWCGKDSQMSKSEDPDDSEFTIFRMASGPPVYGPAIVASPESEAAQEPTFRTCKARSLRRRFFENPYSPTSRISERSLKWLEPRDIFTMDQEYARPKQVTWTIEDDLLENDHFVDLDISSRAEEAERDLGKTEEASNENEKELTLQGGES